jgi:hypothetical protein|tara:strand:+ start:1302 stop:1529 length:228 start_codon:yes stop_codon:yes gene_type:complete
MPELMYMFAGVGVALSMFAFLLKKNKNEIDTLKVHLRDIEIENAKQEEKISFLEKVSEDRRNDIKQIFKGLNEKA